jgi:hypothetical protein
MQQVRIRRIKRPRYDSIAAGNALSETMTVSSYSASRFRATVRDHAMTSTVDSAPLNLPSTGVSIWSTWTFD